MGSGAVRAWARRWVQNPVISVLLFAVFVMLLVVLPIRSGRGGMRPVLTVLAVRAGEGFRIVDPDNESWDEASGLLQHSPDDVVFVGFREGSYLEGMMAPTRHIVERAVRVENSKLTMDGAPGLRGNVRKAFVAWLNTANRGRYQSIAAELAAGDVRRVTVLWSGYVLDTLLFVTLALLVYSLAWVPLFPAWLAATRRQRALARERCPHCGYSIVGLRERVCPECGKSWDVTAEDPPVDAGASE